MSRAALLLLLLGSFAANAAEHVYDSDSTDTPALDDPRGPGITAVPFGSAPPPGAVLLGDEPPADEGRHDTAQREGLPVDDGGRSSAVCELNEPGNPGSGCSPLP